MKNRYTWLTLAVAAAVAVAAPVFLLGSGGDVEAGKAVYDKKCASCHAKDGAGNPGIAKALKVELRHLGSKEVQALSDDELKKVITEGTEKKKPVKGLSDEDLANVIAYVRTLQQK